MNRSISIDLLRALAILMVLGAHMETCPVETSGLLHSITATWKCGGWTGVDLFFVLSGFLVSGLLFREYEKYGFISPKSFLIRRGFKIYPAFWFFIFVSVAVGFLVHNPVHPHSIVSELLFIQNYRSQIWPHTWSLAVEEHFYLLLLIFLLWLSKRRQFSVIPMAFIVLAVVCLVLRIVTAIEFSGTEIETQITKRHIYPTHLRIDSLFFGVLISYFYHHHGNEFLRRTSRYKPALLAIGVLCFVPAFVFSVVSTPFIYTFGMTIFYLGSGALLTCALSGRLPQNAFFRSIAYIGSHSYSIYLWHMSVLRWIIPAFGPALSPQTHWFFYFAVYVGGSIGLGILMAIILEFPMLRLRDKLFPSRSQPIPKVVSPAAQPQQITK